MPINHDTLLRQWQMLRSIPKYPQKITATQIKSKLDNEDFIVSKRTVERDLMELSLIFPLMLDDRSRPYGWSWKKDSATFNLPGYDKNEALAMLMLEQNLSSLLPSSTIEALTPHFKAAKQYLNNVSKEEKLRSWVNKVRTVPSNQSLLAPKIDQEIQTIVSDALLSEKQIEIIYRGHGKKEVSKFKIHPLAMIQRGNTIYLTSIIEKKDGIRNIALHRIKWAKLLEETSVYPKSFNIDKEIEKGLFGFGKGNMINLTVKFSEEFGQYFLETKLSDDQKVKIKDGNIFITANIADTPQLQWWLLSLGNSVEVISPQSVRSNVINKLNQAVAIYRK